MNINEAREILDGVDMQSVIDSVKNTIEWNKCYELPTECWTDACNKVKCPALIKAFNLSIDEIRNILIIADPNQNAGYVSKFQDILKHNSEWVMIEDVKSSNDGPSKWDQFCDSTMHRPEATSLRRF